jgi:uncharacterized protein
MASRSRIFIIHGFNATPQDAWLPWLTRALQRHGIDVHAPQMPHPRWPYIRRWTDQLAQEVGCCDERTYFIGHSLGGQAILRYLTTLPKDQCAGGAVFVGGFDRLRIWWPYLIVAYLCLGRWLLQPIDWHIARNKSRRFCAVFSDNDGWVTRETSDRFRSQLDARIRVLHGYGHFTGDEGVFQVPEILDEVLQMIQRKEPPGGYAGQLSGNVLDGFTSRTLVSPLRTVR